MISNIGKPQLSAISMALLALGSAAIGNVKADETKADDVSAWGSNTSNTSTDYNTNLANSRARSLIGDNSDIRKGPSLTNRRVGRKTILSGRSGNRRGIRNSRAEARSGVRLDGDTSYSFEPSRGDEPPIIKRVNGRTIRYIKSGTQRFVTRRVSRSRPTSVRFGYTRPTVSRRRYSSRAERSRVIYENDKDILSSSGRTFYRRIGGNIIRYIQAPRKLSRTTHYSRGKSSKNSNLDRKVRTLSKSLILLFKKMTGLNRSFKTYQRVLANSFKRRDRTMKSILRTLNRLVRSNNKRKLYVTKIMNSSNPNWSVLNQVEGTSVGSKHIETSKSKSSPDTSYKASRPISAQQQTYSSEGRRSQTPKIQSRGSATVSPQSYGENGQGSNVYKTKSSDTDDQHVEFRNGPSYAARGLSNLGLEAGQQSEAKGNTYTSANVPEPLNGRKNLGTSY